MFALLSGLLAGGLHVLSGPDHLAAVLPLAARAPERGRQYGAIWGLGHGGGMLLWLALAWLFRSAIPLARISGLAELLVGFSLLAVGLWTFQSRELVSGPDGAEQGAALGLGMLHGTAGAGHLFGVLPLLGLSIQGGALYCIGFVLAGILSMAVAGLAAGHVSKLPSIGVRARPICACVTLVVGAVWIADALLA